MNRRTVLKTLPLTTLSGCVTSGFTGESEPARELWTVDVETAEIETVAFTAEARRATATTDHPPALWLEFRNTLSEPLVLVEIDTPYWSDISPESSGLILIPDELDIEPQSEECWRPAYIPGGDGGLSSFKVQPSDAWSIRHALWIDEQEQCVPDGTYDFTGAARLASDYDQSMGWTLEVTATPVE